MCICIHTCTGHKVLIYTYTTIHRHILTYTHMHRAPVHTYNTYVLTCIHNASEVLTRTHMHSTDTTTCTYCTPVHTLHPQYMNDACPAP